MSSQYAGEVVPSLQQLVFHAVASLPGKEEPELFLVYIHEPHRPAAMNEIEQELDQLGVYYQSRRSRAEIELRHNAARIRIVSENRREDSIGLRPVKWCRR